MPDEGALIEPPRCQRCNGKMRPAVVWYGEDLPPQAWKTAVHLVKDCDLLISVGTSGIVMPAAGLPDDSVWRIVAYIRSLRARASDENVEGNLEHGAELFHGTARCSECHMIRGNGGLLGPDLSNIGAERTLRQLREALTTVRPNTPFGFQPVRIRTKSGETVDGVVKNENNFSMQVLDRQNRLHLLNREDVKDVDYGRKSLMPNDYGERLTTGELQDVLLFLSRQVQ